MNRRHFLKCTGSAFLYPGLLAQAVSKNIGPSKPNILLIMVDDMGFSDINCYGGEIDTPNLQKLAADGLRFTQFYNAARCCPTRASLLTGLYSHKTGIGFMTAVDYGKPGYRADLNTNCVTIAEALMSNGYNTYMAGKWHACKDFAPNALKNDMDLFLCSELAACGSFDLFYNIF